MDDGLAAGIPRAAEPMRIGITGKQERLEEKHAGGPDRGSASEPRQNVAAHHRLHQKQKKGAQEDSDGIASRHTYGR